MVFPIFLIITLTSVIRAKIFVAQSCSCSQNLSVDEFQKKTERSRLTKTKAVQAIVSSDSAHVCGDAEFQINIIFVGDS